MKCTICKRTDKITEPLAPILPTFHSTEEALAFGRTATEDQREALRERRESMIAQATISNLKGRKQHTIDLLCAVQFDREALEA